MGSFKGLFKGSFRGSFEVPLGVFLYSKYARI